MPASVPGPHNDPGGGEQSEVLAATNRRDFKKHVIRGRGWILKKWVRLPSRPPIQAGGPGSNPGRVVGLCGVKVAT